MLSEKLRALGAKAAELKRHVEDIETEMRSIREAWPDHQMVGGAEWNSRDVTPPKGWIWASDGDGVWLISTDGTIGSGATAVKFWTRAFIPSPPQAHVEERPNPVPAQ